MAPTEDNPETPDTWFETWTLDSGLSRKTVLALRKVECADANTLQLLRESDVSRLEAQGDVSLGQALLLTKAITKLRGGSTPEHVAQASGDATNNGDETPNIPQAIEAAAGQLPSAQSLTIRDIRAQASALESAGETLDNLFGAGASAKYPLNDSSRPPQNTGPAPARSPHSVAHDPRSLLVVKSHTRKAVHITDFLTERAGTQRRQKRRDHVVARAADGDGQLVIEKDNAHPYHGIFQAEWGAANMRLLNHLLVTGDLPRDEIEFYLAYTSTVHDFCARYEWSSILDFDHKYREQMACNPSMQWGYTNPMMELNTLVPRAVGQAPHAQPRAAAVRYGPESTEVCKLWLASGGNCRFGARCKYSHEDVSPPVQDARFSEGPKNGQRAHPHAQAW